MKRLKNAMRLLLLLFGLISGLLLSQKLLDSGFRQKGIGTEFVKTALERAKERGRKHATAYATVEPLRKTYANV